MTAAPGARDAYDEKHGLECAKPRRRPSYLPLRHSDPDPPDTTAGMRIIDGNNAELF